MTIQNKILLALTIIAFAVIGTYAWQVLPGYLSKTNANAPAAQQQLTSRLDDYTRGAASATPDKTIIEFGDIECPYCAQIDPQISSLLTTHPDLKLVWKDCPLPNHPNAEQAAEASRCAGQQGKFWEYRDLLLAANNQLNPDFYASAATGLKLDTVAFATCFSSGMEQARVEQSLTECANNNVAELPWFSVNGKIATGTNAVAELTSILNAK